MSAAFEIGEYWSREVQIEVVGLREGGWTDLGECKWRRVRSPAALAAALRAKAERYPNPRNATLQLRVFTRGAVGRARRRAPEVRWHSLAERYGETDQADARG